MPPDRRAITVNGRRLFVRGDDVSYGELVVAAYPDSDPTRGRSLTVTYSGGPVGAYEGSLLHGERVRVLDGEKFSVFRTDKS